MKVWNQFLCTQREEDEHFNGMHMRVITQNLSNTIAIVQLLSVSMSLPIR